MQEVPLLDPEVARAAAAAAANGVPPDDDIRAFEAEVRACCDSYQKRCPNAGAACQKTAMVLAPQLPGSGCRSLEAKGIAN